MNPLSERNGNYPTVAEAGCRYQVNTRILPGYLVCEGHGEVPTFLAVVVVADRLLLIAEHSHSLFVVFEETVARRTTLRRAACVCGVFYFYPRYL